MKVKLEAIQCALFSAYDLKNAMTTEDKRRPTENENFGVSIKEVIEFLEMLENQFPTAERTATETKTHSRIHVDLTGPEGNALNLLGLATMLSSQLGMDGEAITKEMMTGNYENLIATFKGHFGDFVTLHR